MNEVVEFQQIIIKAMWAVGGILTVGLLYILKDYMLMKKEKVRTAIEKDIFNAMKDMEIRIMNKFEESEENFLKKVEEISKDKVSIETFLMLKDIIDVLALEFRSAKNQMRTLTDMVIEVLKSLQKELGIKKDYTKAFEETLKNITENKMEQLGFFDKLKQIEKRLKVNKI